MDSEGGVHSGSFCIAAGPLHRPAAPESQRSGGHLGTGRHLAGAESVQPGPQKKAESPSRRPGESRRHLTANPAPRQAPPLFPVTRGPALGPALGSAHATYFRLFLHVVGHAGYARLLCVQALRCKDKVAPRCFSRGRGCGDTRHPLAMQP